MSRKAEAAVLVGLVTAAALIILPMPSDPATPVSAPVATATATPVIAPSFTPVNVPTDPEVPNPPAASPTATKKPASTLSKLYATDFVVRHLFHPFRG